MDELSIQLLVYFEEPFWIGVLERVCENNLSVCKVTFGAEPKDYEVFDFYQRNCYQLQFSPTVENCIIRKDYINPKRVQREVKNQLLQIKVGTKSQQALNLLHEQNKLERKIRNREQQEEEKARQFDLRQKKKREKHKGR